MSDPRNGRTMLKIDRPIGEDVSSTDVVEFIEEVVSNTCTNLSDPMKTATTRRRCQVYEPLESSTEKMVVPPPFSTTMGRNTAAGAALRPEEVGGAASLKEEARERERQPET